MTPVELPTQSGLLYSEPNAASYVVSDYYYWSDGYTMTIGGLMLSGGNNTFYKSNRCTVEIRENIGTNYSNPQFF